MLALLSAIVVVVFLLVKAKKTRPTDDDYLGKLHDRQIAEARTLGYTEAPDYIEPKLKSFQPQDFIQYIGQRKAKNILTAFITGSQAREKILPHVLISGSAGYGKTTLAQIIAKKLNVRIVTTIASNITDIKIVLDMINTAQGGVVFLDEIHSMSREMAEKLYTIMENFQYDGKEIPQFTLIGATTELGEIIKDRKPFLDRFKIQIELEDYTVEDLEQLISQYNEKEFPQEIQSRNVLNIIAKNCRNTPRKAIALLETTILLNGNVDQVLKNNSIIKDGYTQNDKKVLEYLKQNEKGVGLTSLTGYLGTSQENYMHQIEGYLLRNGMIVRTPRGRKISPQGVELLAQLY